VPDADGGNFGFHLRQKALPPWPQGSFARWVARDPDEVAVALADRDLSVNTGRGSGHVQALSA
jgi:hypothetical protein